MKEYHIAHQTYEWYTVHLHCYIANEPHGYRKAFVFAKSHEDAMDMMYAKMLVPNNHECIFRVRSWCTRPGEMQDLSDCLETHAKQDKLKKVLFIPKTIPNEEEDNA